MPDAFGVESRHGLANENICICNLQARHALQ